MGCCDQSGLCNAQAKLVVVEAAQRLAGMARAGQLTAASWADEERLPEPEVQEQTTQ